MRWSRVQFLSLALIKRKEETVEVKLNHTLLKDILEAADIAPEDMLAWLEYICKELPNVDAPCLHHHIRNRDKKEFCFIETAGPDPYGITDTMIFITVPIAMVDEASFKLNDFWMIVRHNKELQQKVVLKFAALFDIPPF